MADLPLWSPQELIAATGGRIEGVVSKPLNGVAIDNRAIAPGDIFVAIKGENHDAHDFAASALKAGAGIAMVSRTTEDMKDAGALLIVADDPLRGLENLGIAGRQRSHAQIIGVTGSVGKTSSKEMLKVALSASGLTHASAASLNNHWGVPLTLARMPRETAYAVIEIGMNHAGEITPLVGMAKPHTALVTSIAASHLGHFASLGEIADAKAEIFSGVEPDGNAVINRDTPYFDQLAAAAKSFGIRNIVSFGRHADADVRLERLVLHTECCCVTAKVMGEDVIYKLGLPGEHMALNSLGVLAAVKVMGADLARAALALATAKPAKGRGVREHLAVPGGDILLIDESYNANPASVRAALSLLAQAQPKKTGRRIAILGDMLELGTQGPTLHAELAPVLDEAKVDLVYAAGPLMANLWAKIPAAKRGNHAPTIAELRDEIVNAMRPNDVVMVKGSLGSKMGPLTDALRRAYPPVSKDV
ncbi:UDP-N-acetylmuramoylalanyl-D-glutamyl-2,6-diaminopimelate--D-alanyl-D-alanine ligase [Aestuariivirga sp.]|uniref:UDP-N-acetylmuramoylalanyl-D-glutamyl-2, 6-diaminopimelate--D-alanyl-D-alanine ligase n=1 Tax=Aestuariivirga sp. TaxID=2650926 RepID=UPI0039E559A4